MIVVAGLLVSAIIATAAYVALRLYAYYLVDGVSRVLEAIEQQPAEGTEQ